MNIDFPLDCYRSGIVQNAESVFATLLHTPIRELPASQPGAYPLNAAVSYCGAWTGALLLGCSEQQAVQWSAKLMQLLDPTAEDARDGLGELANVLAGNLKTLLPPGVGISLPEVRAETPPLSPGDRIESITFADASGPFTLSLLKRK